MSDDEDEGDLPSKGRTLSPEEVDQTIDALVQAVAEETAPVMRETPCLARSASAG